MRLAELVKDLEEQGFQGNLREDDGVEYFVFGLSLQEGKYQVYAMAKIIDKVVYISTVDLIKDARLEDLPIHMALNDLLITGKLFMSTDINDIDKIGSGSSIIIDYGFEILVEYYDPRILGDYIQLMFANLEELVLKK